MIMIKKMFDLISKMFKKVFKRYPITILSILFGTVFFTVFLDSDILLSTTIEKVLVFLVLFTSSSFFIENYFEKKKVFYLIFLFVSILLTICSYLENSMISSFSIRVDIAFILIINLLSLYKLFKDSNEGWNEYFVKVFANTLKISIWYGFLSIGLILVVSVFSYLLLNGDSYEILFRVEILVLGLFYLPNLIGALTDTKGELASFIKILIKYILDSLLILSFIIIYLYILKIILTWSIPSNEIFRILSVLFIFGFFIWTMSDYFSSDNDLLDKINKYLPIAFIPFVFLQIYSLLIRIVNNGFTIIRYLGLMLIIFEIIYLFLYLFKKEKIHLSIIYGSIILFVSLLFPWINMYHVTSMSQISLIKKYLNSPSMNVKIVSSYLYLKGMRDGNIYIDKYLEDEKLQINDILKNNNYSIENIYINGENKEKIDIKNYQFLLPFSLSEYNISQVLVLYNNKEYDITSLIDSYIKEYNIHNFDNYFDEHYTIDFYDVKIILQKIYLSYELSSSSINYIEISGYILEK